MELARQELFDRFHTPTRSVDTYLLRILDLLNPEIVSRSLQLELDLDHVQVPTLNHDLQTAIRGLVVNAIEASLDHTELSITLIDSPGIGTPGHWELEICDLTVRGFDQASGNLELDLDLFSNHVLSEDETRSIAARSERNNLATALQAAQRCNGSIEAWHCPQGGIAMILVMPRPAIKAAA